MMRERVEFGFHGGEMRDVGAFVTKSLPEIKFQKMVEQTNDVLMFLKILVLCMVFKVNKLQDFCQVC